MLYSSKSGKKAGPKLRWVLQLDEDHWIWEWAKDDSKIEASTIYGFYKNIKEGKTLNSGKSDNIFEVKLEDNKNNTIVPVIYQPAVDALENYIREIHCAQTQNKAVIK